MIGLRDLGELELRKAMRAISRPIAGTYNSFQERWDRLEERLGVRLSTENQGRIYAVGAALLTAKLTHDANAQNYGLVAFEILFSSLLAYRAHRQSLKSLRRR